MEWVPSTTDVRDIKGQGVGQKWHYTYKMAGVSLKGESDVTEYIANQRYVHKTKGGVLSTWTYTFKPEGAGTQLTLAVEYTIPVPVLGKVGELLTSKRNEREADLAMTNVREKLET
jgi:hypothetical protein